MQMVRPANPVDKVDDTENLRYIVRVKDNSGFVFVNNAQVRIPMPEKTFRMKLDLNGETLEFPRKAIVLKDRTTAIFPFNFNLNGVKLKYATAQPMARLMHGETEYVFLTEVPGTEPELAFDAATLSAVSASGWTSDTEKGITYLTPQSGKVVELTAAAGKRAVVVILTRAEAENAWRTMIDGQESLVLTTADLTTYDNTIQLTSSTIRCSV
ncbi:MAG: hypothetical protein AB2L20_12740 [Mangrovibacterium sp.]